jgi:N-acetyl-anhydromuramoyl-L-alanine amidase
MKIDPAGERLLQARQVATPNCDARPPGSEVSLVVIHGISLPPGHYGGPEIDQLFTNRLDAAAHPYFAAIAGLKVSAHLLIRRDGELVQYVPFNLRAWHAGESCYEGCSACNDFSIGIELEGQDDEAYTNEQYAQLAAVLEVLIETFPHLSAGRIAGHSDISPGRKTDPGPAFDWGRLQRRLAMLQTQQVG